MGRILFAALIAIASHGTAQAKSSAPQIGTARAAGPRRIHLLTVAKRLAVFNNPVPNYYVHYHTYFNDPKLRLVQTPPRATDPSKFERLLKRFYQPEKLVEVAPFVERGGRLPRAYPWQREVTKHSLFRETAFFRGAAINALARLADREGYLDMQTLERELSHHELERRMLAAIKRPARRSELSSATWDHVYAYLDRTAARKIGKRTGRLVPKMPALRWVQKQYDPNHALAGIRRMWTKQHLVGNTLGLLEVLGIPSNRVEVWGKTYSRDPRVVSQMQEQGYRVNGDSVQRDRSRIEQQVAAECAKISDPKAFKKPIFMILDDGGDLIKIVAETVRKRFPDHAHLFAAVEQTVGGVNLLRGENVPFAVNPSGTSWGKRHYGNPMFARAVSNEIVRLAESYRRLLTLVGSDDGKATVRGFGEMGSAVARELRAAGLDVMVWDQSARKRRAARGAGFKVGANEDAALKFGSYFVSATGTERFTHDDFFRLRRNAVVFNAASANEFERIGDPFGLPPLNTESGPLPSSSWTTRLLTRPNPKNPTEIEAIPLHFIKDGGVINFPLGLDHPRAGKAVPGRYIQFQLGLLYLDLLRAAEGGRARSPKTLIAKQRALKNFVQAQLAKRNENLLTPRF